MKEILNRLDEAKEKKPKKESLYKWKDLTARNWELYSDMKGVGKAARAMNAAMRKAYKVIEKDLGKYKYDEAEWGKRLAAVYYKHVEPVMRKHSSFGAYDSEPRYHVMQGLISIVKDWYGIDGWTGMGDYI